MLRIVLIHNTPLTLIDVGKKQEIPARNLTHHPRSPEVILEVEFICKDFAKHLVLFVEEEYVHIYIGSGTLTSLLHSPPETRLNKRKIY